MKSRKRYPSAIPKPMIRAVAADGNIHTDVDVVAAAVAAAAAVVVAGSVVMKLKGHRQKGRRRTVENCFGQS